MLASALGALILSPGSALDLGFGGSLGTDYSIALASGLEDRAGFRFFPLFNASGSLGPREGSGAVWELRAEGRFEGGTTPARTGARLESLRGSLTYGPLGLELGYGTDSAPAAEVFPQATFLGPSDPLSLLSSGGVSAERRGEPYAQCDLLLDRVKASILCAPFRPELVLPDLDSPWFPPSSVPSSFAMFDGIYTLKSLSYENADENRWCLEPSYLASASASLGPADLDLRYFHGRERQAFLWGRVDIDSVRGYSVYLQPNRAIVDSLALSSTVVEGPFRLWLETSATRGASLASGSVEWRIGSLSEYCLSSDFSETEFAPIVNRDRLGLTLGASWSPGISSGTLVAFAEGCYAAYRDAPADSDLPALSRAVALGLSGAFFEERLDLSLKGIVSLKDGSRALRPAIGTRFGAEGRLELSSLLLFGDESSELGQYSSQRFLALSLTQQF